MGLATRIMLIFVLFGAVFLQSAAVLSKPVEVKRSPMVSDRLLSRNRKPAEIEKLIAAQGPKYAKKIQDLLALVESIDFGCKEMDPEDFKDPGAMSRECHDLLWFWSMKIFRPLGFYSKKLDKKQNFNALVKMVLDVKANPNKKVDELARAYYSKN